MPPNLVAVAKTLIGHETVNGGGGGSAESAGQLRAENARLKQRLAAVEDVSTHYHACAAHRIACKRELFLLLYGLDGEVFGPPGHARPQCSHIAAEGCHS